MSSFFKILLLFTLSMNSFSGTKGLYPFREDLFKKTKSNKFLDKQITYVRDKFYKVFSINIIPKKKSKKERGYINKMLNKLDDRIKYQQKLLSSCSFNYSRKCRLLLKNYIGLLENEVDYTTKMISKIKISYIKNTMRSYKFSLISQYIYFNSKYASLSIQEKKVQGDHLYSTHKFLRDSVMESFDYFARLANHKSVNHFISFFHRFILPTHNITANYSNHSNIIRNFEDLSRTLYDFSFYMDKFEKISKSTKVTANSMMTHWNYIHKYFTRR